MRKLLTNKKMSVAMRQRTLQCYVEPILMYGCEVWTITKPIQKKLEAVERWFWRKVLRIPWKAIMTNIDVMEEVGQVRSFVNRVRKQQAAFIGHIMRREGLQHLIAMGKIRQGETERTKINDEPSCCKDEHKKVNVCNFGSYGSRTLERHSCRSHEVGHLIILIKPQKRDTK